MTVIAAIRPDSIDLAVVVHVLGAMVLVGGVLTAATASLVGWRDESDALQRFSYKTLLAVGLPGYIVMRLAAQWAYSKEHLDDLPSDQEPAWVGIGFILADVGGLLLLLALILGGIGLRRSGQGSGSGLLKASGILATVLLAAYVVAVWAMAGKPD